ncbi:hypothetical protein ANOM_008836 [Aspergillus nomiae NRRL 13137]|uniref:C2H2-type domain-containing protein n=1 Tax=Aspergillus nomiae NRRL (strain ATCC 15546 / NRRL 13137 / CBS 260.88 / M93) TaxID=1509407 RepID=A0A0L1IUL3_ASPN3|nr:uncharacterized protein ANOM_008836 [Aspergillus nomiae NRRL 13137]KNG83187.1 hypothetical protein ANOM_008836 [Aspergillus nomiae NRRL 13137]
MSVSHANRRIPSYQPYQCHVCQSRFTRHENLKRHAKLHSRSPEEASLPCDFCQTTFSRPDLRHRHMKRKHPEYEQRRAMKRSLREPIISRPGSDARRPERHDVYLSSESSPDSQDGFHPQNSGDECELEVDGGIWNAPLPQTQHPLFHDHDAGSSTSGPATAEVHREQVVTGPSVQEPSINESDCMGRMVQDAIELERNLLLGTSFLKPTYELDDQLQSAIIPQPSSFDTNTPGASLAKAVLIHFHRTTSSIGPHHIHKLHAAVTSSSNIFRTFSHFCTNQHSTPHISLYTYSSVFFPSAISTAKTQSLAIKPAQAQTYPTDTPKQNTTLIQSYLLLQICAMMYLCGDSSSSGLKMHSNMISLAREGGLMQPMPTATSTTEDLEALWHEFIKAESHKRTSFAVHQIDALWYQFLSIPRSISHLEVKHDLPCPEAQWTAPSAAEWAHRHLVARNPGPAVPYPDAVRRFLSSDALPHLQRARVSGWSTMTGMLSMDRLDALRSSLLSLGPFIRPQPETAKAMHAIATWETAMIELHLWSPAHTGGIVAASLDAVVSQSTSLAPSYEFLWEADTAKAIQPHVDWFLRYLDTTREPDSEAPWVAVYAYKAFLIAWQLVRGGIPNAMRVVGIADGDVEGALGWVREVFRRRERWMLGRLVLSCLDGLGS